MKMMKCRWTAIAMAACCLLVAGCTVDEEMVGEGAMASTVEEGDPGPEPGETHELGYSPSSFTRSCDSGASPCRCVAGDCPTDAIFGGIYDPGTPLMCVPMGLPYWYWYLPYWFHYGVIYGADWPGPYYCAPWSEVFNLRFCIDPWYRWVWSPFWRPWWWPYSYQCHYWFRLGPWYPY